MKTDRRHDLETNVLAARLTRWLEKLKPYSGQVVGGIVVLFGILVIGSFWNSTSSARQEAAWDAYALAQDTTDAELMSLRRVADDEKYMGTSMQDWAHVTWADRQVLIASQSYLIDRSAALDRLRQVEGVYETLIADARDPQVRDRAHFGLARIYELQGKLDEAIQQYEMVQGDLQPLASRRATQLSSPEVQEAVKWLATAELPKRSTSSAPGGMPGRPNFEADVPGTSPADTRTLDDILKDLGGVESSEDRYGEESSDEAPAEKEATDTATEDQATSEVPAESENPSATGAAAEDTGK